MMMVDPHAVERLAKICGKFGSDSDNERAVAARLADDFLKSLGLRWHDVIRVPLEPIGSDWRRLANYCYAHIDRLSFREANFIDSIGKRKREPTLKQLDWLKGIFDRLQKGHQ